MVSFSLVLYLAGENMKRQILVILLIACLGNGYSQNYAGNYVIAKNNWTQFLFRKDLGGPCLYLYCFDDTVIRGRYFENCEKKILFKGEQINNDIVLTGYFNNKKYRYMTISLVQDSGYYNGYWLDSAGGNRTPFKIAAGSVTPGTVNKRYSEFGRINYEVTDDEVEDFAKAIKSAVIANDRAWLASHIDFPIAPMVNKKLLPLSNAEDFLKNYGKIVTPEVKVSMPSACPYNLDFWKEGAMMDIFTIRSRPASDKTLIIDIK